MGNWSRALGRWDHERTPVVETLAGPWGAWFCSDGPIKPSYQQAGSWTMPPVHFLTSQMGQKDAIQNALCCSPCLVAGLRWWGRSIVSREPLSQLPPGLPTLADVSKNDLHFQPLRRGGACCGH